VFENSYAETVNIGALHIVAVMDIPVSQIDPVEDDVRLSFADDLRYVYGDHPPLNWLGDDPGRDYPSMIQAAHSALSKQKLLEDIRVVILVTSSPDLQHERLLGGFASELFNDQALTFCVSEQESAGPFTALRLAQVLLAQGMTGEPPQGGSALILVLEQSTLPPSNMHVPGRDRVVAIVASYHAAGRPVDWLEIKRVKGASQVEAFNACREEWNLKAGSVVDGGRIILGARAMALSVPTPKAGVVLRADPKAASTGVWEILAARNDDIVVAPTLILEQCITLGYQCSLILGPPVSSLTRPYSDGGTRKAILA
jgi:hypothetical protein